MFTNSEILGHFVMYYIYVYVRAIPTYRVHRLYDDPHLHRARACSVKRVHGISACTTVRGCIIGAAQCLSSIDHEAII